MEFLNSMLIFFNSILNIKIFDNITLLEILIYLLFVASVTHFLKVAIKGKN